MSNNGCARRWRQALENDGEQFACDVALQDPQDVLARVAALDPAGRVIAGPWIALHADVGDHPKRGVHGAIPPRLSLVEVQLLWWVGLPSAIPVHPLCAHLGPFLLPSLVLAPDRRSS